MERNATSLTQIVEDVLDVSRIMSGKLRLNLEPVDLSGSSTTPSPPCPGGRRQRRRLPTRPDPRGRTGLGYADRLQQVVWNLLSNAVKFTPRRGTSSAARTPGSVPPAITVSDNGTGIEPGFLPHVFERFRQADTGSHANTRRAGSGPRDRVNLVQLHGGSIHVASAGRAHGATFTRRVADLHPLAGACRLIPRHRQCGARRGARVARGSSSTTTGTR